MVSNSRLILSGLRHLFYKKLNRNIIGLSREAELPTISLKDVRLYAEATNDNTEDYSEDSIIPPLFVSRLIHNVLMETICDPNLRMNILKMVHGELEINWFKPVYIADRLRLRMQLKEIIDTSAGELLKISFLITKDGEQAAEAIAGLLIRNPKGEKAKKEEEKREPISVIEIKTQPDQALKYAKASLDNNLIHTSTIFARLVGLKRPILHGVCVFAITCNELLKTFASNDKQRLVSMRGRFAYPVYPGETIHLNCFRGSADNIIDFEVMNKDRKTNIKFGRFEFKK
ncbi:MAG: MaoC/PaaZ C-terminal domain-containing protein [Myxococcota bacterium]